MAQDESIKLAQQHLENEEYTEGMEILQDLQDGPAVEELKYQFEQSIRRKLDALLDAFEEAVSNKEWSNANEILIEAQELDNDDERVQAAANRMTEMFDQDVSRQDIDEKIRRARYNLASADKTIENIDVAIRLLEEANLQAGDTSETLDLLDNARRLRSEFLRSQGEIATLEQAEEFEEALKQVNDLIQRGFREVQGEDIYDFLGKLENKAHNFAEIKAGKYLDMGEEVLDTEPRLTLEYIEKALNFPFIPKQRKEDLENLKSKANLAVKHRDEADKQVNEAVAEMNNNRDYEKAIEILNSVLAEWPKLKPAQRHLERAEKGLVREIHSQARRTKSRVRSLIARGHFDKARSEIDGITDRLHLAGDDEENLRSEFDGLMEQIIEKEDIEHIVHEACASATQALEDDDLSTAEIEIDSLDAKLQNRPEVRRIKTEIAKREKVETAIEKIRKDFDAERLDSAREQIKAIIKKAHKNPEVKSLHDEIESIYFYQNGVNAFDEGNIGDAKKAFNKVVSFNAEYKEEAENYLARIEDLSGQDRKARNAYNTARRNTESQRFEKAYQVLSELEDSPSSVKDKIIDLRVDVRKKWRDQLIKQIKQHLQANEFSQALQLTEKLKEISRSGDVKLINEVNKKYYVAKAKSSASSNDWQEAVENWQNAHRFDPNNKTIANGLLQAQKKLALQQANDADTDDEVISSLEIVYERDNVNPEIDLQLMRAYLGAGEYGKALRVANSRVNRKTIIAAKAKSIRTLCMELKASAEKLEQGAFRESIDILENCSGRFRDFDDILQDLITTRRKKIIDTLLKEAKDPDSEKEGVVYKLLKYQEVLAIEPDHREAKEQRSILRDEFDRHVADLIQESLSVEDDENIGLHEVEGMIKGLTNAKRLANPQQVVKLESRLDRLSPKRQSLRTLEKKLISLQGLLPEARATGDFDKIEQIRDEAVKFTSSSNRKLNELAKAIRIAKEKRLEAERMAEQILTAFEGQDFSTLERLAGDLARIDPSDDFSLQRNHLRLSDPFTDEEINFNDLKGWSQDRRKNLEHLSSWFERNESDFATLEQNERELRDNALKSDNVSIMAKRYKEMAADYKKNADAFAQKPQVPLSQSADEIANEAVKLRNQAQKKAQQLEDDARTLLKNEELVQDFIESADNLIIEKKFKDAKQIVDQGLEIAPDHPYLVHLRDVIHDYE